MSEMLSPAQIERLKREAKKLCRANPGLVYSHILDRQAEKYGYQNWSILAKHHIDDSAATSKPALKFIRTTDEMRLALRKAPEPRYHYDRPSPEQIVQSQVEDICDTLISAKNAVDYAIDYVTCLLSVPRLKIYGASKVYFEMRCWLPYCAHETDDGHHLLVNRRYKPVGQISKEWANYQDFQHLFVQLSDKQLQMLSPYGASKGYLFADGSAPWSSRRKAENYLERLKMLQQMLKG